MAEREGRPLLFESVEELEAKINEYFEITKIEEWTICGLAVHLNTSRQTICNYQGKLEYFDTIKKAKDKVEYSYELSLRKRGSAGDIFGLKNFGWSDKQEVEHSTPEGRSFNVKISTINGNKLDSNKEADGGVELPNGQDNQ
jgi:hypothetical protein